MDSSGVLPGGRSAGASARMLPDHMISWRIPPRLAARTRMICEILSRTSLALIDRSALVEAAQHQRQPPRRAVHDAYRHSPVLPGDVAGAVLRGLVAGCHLRDDLEHAGGDAGRDDEVAGQLGALACAAGEQLGWGRRDL